MSPIENKSLILRIVVVVSAALLVVGIYWSQNRVQKKPTDKTTVTKEDAVLAEKFYLDSDGDGLYDWEEVLWGTDPNDPDTDGDGTPDGEEVRLGRDPRIPGPDDRLETEEIPIYKRDDIENLSPAELLHREAISNISELTKKGNVSRSTLEQMIGELSNKYLTRAEIKRKYLPSSVLISTNNSSEGIREYVNLISQISSVYDFKLSNEDALGLVTNIISPEKDAKLSAKLARLIDDIEKTEITLSMVSVPSDLAAAHTSMLNALYTIHSGLNMAQNQPSSERMEAFTALNTVSSGISLLSLSSIEIQNKVTELGIQFNQNEAGRFFLR